VVAVDDLVVVGVKKQHRGFYDLIATITIANLTEQQSSIQLPSTVEQAWLTK
jgi:hypothetical protein